MSGSRWIIEDTETGEVFDGSNFVLLENLEQLFRVAKDIDQTLANFRQLFWHPNGLKVWELVSYLASDAKDAFYQPEQEEAPRRYSPDYYEAQVRS